jgi:hypothetical protein
MPITAFRGVRISWDMVDRNSDFVFRPCWANRVAFLKLSANRWERDKDCKKKKVIYPVKTMPFMGGIRPKKFMLISRRIASMIPELNRA